MSFSDTLGGVWFQMPAVRVSGSIPTAADRLAGGRGNAATCSPQELQERQGSRRRGCSQSCSKGESSLSARLLPSPPLSLSLFRFSLPLPLWLVYSSSLYVHFFISESMNRNAVDKQLKNSSCKRKTKNDPRILRLKK